MQHTFSVRWITQTCYKSLLIAKLGESASLWKWRNRTGSCWFSLYQDPTLVPSTWNILFLDCMFHSLSVLCLNVTSIAFLDYYDKNRPLPYHKYYFSLVIWNSITVFSTRFMTAEISCLEQISCSTLSSHCLKHYLPQTRYSVNICWVNKPCQPSGTYIRGQ